jgi:hypothetical protein
MGVPDDPRRSVAEDEIRAETVATALDVLGDLDAWRLSEPRWARVEEILEALTAAVAAADLDGVRQATADLEVIGPVRITRIGAVPVVPPPRRVRDRTNHLVHLLTEAVDAAGRPARQDGLGGGGDRSRTD